MKGKYTTGGAIGGNKMQESGVVKVIDKPCIANQGQMDFPKGLPLSRSDAFQPLPDSEQED